MSKIPIKDKNKFLQRHKHKDDDDDGRKEKKIKVFTKDCCGGGSPFTTDFYCK